MNPDVAAGQPPPARAAFVTSTITLGYLSPLTGWLAGFASGDRFVIEPARAT